MSLEYLATPPLSPLSPMNEEQVWTLENILAQASFAYAFLSSLTMVFLSEFGDKTFIATVLMTMEFNIHTTSTSPSHLRHGLVILTATNLACAMIAIITSLISYFTLSWLQISPHYMVHVSTAACIIFGIQILYDTWMVKEEEEKKEIKSSTSSSSTSSTTTSTATSTSTASSSSTSSKTITNGTHGTTQRRLSLPVSITAQSSLTSIFYKTFFWSLMTELGDRSQLGMMMLSSQQHLNVYGILCGGVLGHILCTVVAIVFGECSSSYISPKWMATTGGIMFLVMAVYGV